ncbi:DDE-type integrase/transposase/recombinase [Burkholderia sp. BDU5]|uniref:DDE-type integrase/transposase/recombinase n=1 Tax=Burkholderia sp. BDU5 TaxID=1385590 RepID=UPI00075DD3C4|nr:DDE-type integrase/transposase/recombinase [Burkholderia sp. BDU5]KVE36221.1 integrase [Burkholderia sp. BDU5]
MIDFELIAAALSITKRSAERRATRENWPFELEAVRGGQRKLFDLANLPADVRKAVERYREIKARGDAAGRTLKLIEQVRADAEAERAAKNQRAQESLKKLTAELPPGVQARFDARYEIVKSWETWFVTVQPMSRRVSWPTYTKAYNLKEIEVAAAVRSTIPSISPRSLQRWVLEYERVGLAGLIDEKDGRHQRDVNVFTKQPELEKTALALLIDRPNLGIQHIVNLLNQASVDADSGEILFAAPSYDATYRFVTAWRRKHDGLFTAATNPDEWKNKYMTAFGDASADVDRLNQRWEMDATPADWMLTDEDGVERRYSASVVIDVYSRRKLVVLAPTPKTETHKYALRLALLLWGVPEEIVTDNGQDYKSRNFIETLAALGIAHYVTAPFSPWQKPHVERGIQTMLHSILEGLSAFIGHSVAERSAIEARRAFSERLFKKGEAVTLAMPASELRALIEQWIRGVYEHAHHEGIGMSPYQRASSYTGPVHRIEDERALDVLLAPPAGKGRYTVTKKGLRIDNAQFIAPELALYVGKDVAVRITPDLGEVIVYHEGEFVCVARNPERTGVSRAEIAVLARRKQREHVKQQMHAIKGTKVDTDRLVRDLVADKAAQAGKLTALPTRTATHTTDELKAAGTAARALDRVVPKADIPADLQRIIDARQAASQVQPTPESNVKKIRPVPETPELRFRKWQELDQLVAAGGTIDDPILTRWYGQYPQTPEFAIAMRKHRQASSPAVPGTATVATVTRAFN